MVGCLFVCLLACLLDCLGLGAGALLFENLLHTAIPPLPLGSFKGVKGTFPEGECRIFSNTSRSGLFTSPDKAMMMMMMMMRWEVNECFRAMGPHCC